MSWINLRKELHGLIYGDAYGIPQGRWVVVRILRIGEYSSHWDPNLKEAHGGPKWKYDDFIVRAITKPGTTLAGRAGKGVEEDVYLGSQDVINSQLYAIEFNPKFPRIPAIGDIVYEIAEYASVDKPKPPLTVTARYAVQFAHRVTGDFGRTEGIILVARRMEGDE